MPVIYSGNGTTRKAFSDHSGTSVERNSEPRIDLFQSPDVGRSTGRRLFVCVPGDPGSPERTALYLWNLFWGRLLPRPGLSPHGQEICPVERYNSPRKPIILMNGHDISHYRRRRYQDALDLTHIWREIRGG